MPLHDALGTVQANITPQLHSSTKPTTAPPPATPPSFPPQPTEPTTPARPTQSPARTRTSAGTSTASTTARPSLSTSSTATTIPRKFNRRKSPSPSPGSETNDFPILLRSSVGGFNTLEGTSDTISPTVNANFSCGHGRCALDSRKGPILVPVSGVSGK